MIKLYGIPNCDTVKKARRWLADHNIEYQFHDFKKAGVPEAPLQAWLEHFGWEIVLNRKGRTWRQLSEDDRAGVTDIASAKSILLQKPSMIKRPILECGDNVIIGFNEAEFSEVV